ncbi:MAG: SDR family oxidoreductase [Chloroflexi bacterium]|nr:SDR family oxidoreductase [Chloroflexota bacterium]
MRLANKVAVITGGARGIGGAAARQFARDGACVVIGDVLQAEGEETVGIIRAAGGEATFVRVDITREEDCASLVRTAVDRYGRLDVLLTAAGILRGAYLTVDELDRDVFDQVIDINLTGTFLCCKHATKQMRAQRGGVILCIASGAGVRGGSSSVAYGSSKGGVHGLTLVLAPQLEKFGIRVHGICPGSLATPLKIENVIEGARVAGRDPEQVLATADLGDPDLLAPVFAFLASDEAAYIRGTIFTR